MRSGLNPRPLGYGLVRLSGLQAQDLDPALLALALQQVSSRLKTTDILFDARRFDIVPASMDREHRTLVFQDLKTGPNGHFLHMVDLAELLLRGETLVLLIDLIFYFTPDIIRDQDVQI